MNRSFLKANFILLIFAQTSSMRLMMTMIAVCAIITANAQRPVGDFVPIQNHNIPFSNLRNVVDTILPLSFIPVNEGGMGCFTGIYPAPDSGYVSGNNQYGDLEKAQFYDLARMGYADTGAIQSVFVKFAFKTQNASPEDIVVKIYDTKPSGFEPANLLGTSQSVNLSSINANESYTVFNFATPVQVSDSFFLSVQLPLATGDTLVILSTQNNCVENSGWAWEQWKNGTWHSIFNSWILDIDLAIFPVIELPFGDGINELPAASILKVYPNPAADFVTITFPNEGHTPFSICLFDLEGRKVKEFFVSQINELNHSVVLPLAGIVPSVYSLKISSNKASTRIPLIIVK